MARCPQTGGFTTNESARLYRASTMSACFPRTLKNTRVSIPVYTRASTAPIDGVLLAKKPRNHGTWY